MIIQQDQLKELEKRYRATLINSLAGYRQVVLVASCSSPGNTNLAIFNSLIHLGADPGYYGLISRPDSAERHTLNNIRETRSYTCNYVHEKYSGQAHQTSARYTADQSEFDTCGFTEQYVDGILAPFVKESEVKFALSLEEEIFIPQTRSILLVGKIIQLHLPETLLETDGYVQLQKENLLLCSGLDAYHTAGEPTRYPYAKPHP